MAVLLGILVAMSFGTADFVGGRASARASVLGTLVVSQACALAGAVILVLATTATFTGRDVALGVCAGAVNIVGLGLLYHSLANYSAGVVAPVAATVATTVPVAWGLVQGERPSLLVSCGIVLAIAAGALVAREQGAQTARWSSGALVAAVAGAALGTSLVFFAETTEDSGMWPVLSARGTAALLVGLVAIGFVARRRPAAVPRNGTLSLAVAAGALDVAATAMLLLAVRRGLIVVVSPIASLAPGFTVVLAWLVLHEHLATIQRVGLVLALAGIVLVSVG